MGKQGPGRGTTAAATQQFTCRLPNPPLQPLLVQVGGPEIYTLLGMAELAAQVAGADPHKDIKRRKAWPLRLLAPLARLGAPFSSKAAALADGARFVLYSATHDAVGEPYGRSLLRVAFEERVEAVRAALPG